MNRKDVHSTLPATCGSMPMRFALQINVHKSDAAIRSASLVDGSFVR